MSDISLLAAVMAVLPGSAVPAPSGLQNSTFCQVHEAVCCLSDSSSGPLSSHHSAGPAKLDLCEMVAEPAALCSSK